MKTWVFVYFAFRFFADGSEEFFILPTAWFYIRSFGQTQGFLGITLASYSISAIIFSPLLGTLADRFRNIKTILIVSHLVKFFGALIYTIPISEYFPLSGRIIAGLAEGSCGVLLGELVRCSSPGKISRVFIIIDGTFALGTIFGPTIGSLVTFDADILGWKFNAGNSPGAVLSIIWLLFTIAGLFLPKDMDEVPKEIISSDDDIDLPKGKEKSSDNDPPPLFNSKILCLYYLEFTCLVFSSVVSFYTPTLTMEHFHLKLIHVKLIFVVATLSYFVLLLLLYIASNFLGERVLLCFIVLLQTFPIATLTILAFFWQNDSISTSYLLIIYMSLGVPNFGFPVVCSLLSKITDPKHISFYQSSSIAMFHLAVITGRITPAFVPFTGPAILYLCTGLASLWAIGVIWFYLEYSGYGLTDKST